MSAAVPGKDDMMVGHDSAFATTLVDVTDPDTPVWNELLAEFRERLLGVGLLAPASRDEPAAEPTEHVEHAEQTERSGSDEPADTAASEVER